MTALLAAEELSVRLGDTTIVEGIDLALPPGPYGLGLIGESGSGKTTIARTLLGLLSPSAGVVRFRGRDLASLRGSARMEFRRAVQIVLQDSNEALDPRMRIGASIAEALATHRIVPRNARRARTATLLEEVGLDPELASRRPHELSGGQRQRAAIARGLAVEPEVLILDEPTSALDVTVQARILALVRRLREERGLTYLLISHNLAVVDRLCEACCVLRDGEIVERGLTADVLDHPQHPYTQQLRRAVLEMPAA